MKQIMNKKEMSITKMLLSSNAILKPKKNFLIKKKKESMGQSPGEGKDDPLQYSGLENSRDCVVHGVAKSWT